MISIGKTYRLKPNYDKKAFNKEVGFYRNKDLNYLKNGVVVKSCMEVPGSKWGLAYYCIPASMLFPTPAPELGPNRFKEEMVIFHDEFMTFFEQMYLKEEVEQFFKEVKPSLQAFIHKCWENPFPEITCRNCGRSVYVGKCCDNPDIEIKECVKN